MVKKEKSKGDRVKESVTILKKLIEVGISDGSEGYEKTKEALDEWIKTGESAQHLIPFRTYRRNGILTLPSTADKVAEFILRAV